MPFTPITVGNQIGTPKVNFVPLAQKPEQVQLGQGAAGEFSGNAVRTVAEPLLRTGGLIEKGLDQTLGRVGNFLGGKGFVPSNTGDTAMKVADQSASQHADTPAGALGDITGTIAPYFVGGGEAKLASEAPTLIPKVLDFLAQHAPQFLKDTAIATAQTGDVNKGLDTGIGAQVISLLSKPVSATGKAIYKALAIPTSAGEARLVQAYNANTPLTTRLATALEEAKGPITAAETAFSKGLAGTESMIGTQAVRAKNSIWKNVINPALKSVEEKVNLPNFFGEAEKQIVESTPELSRQKSLLEALSALKEDYKGVTDVSLEQLQKFKEGWAKFIPDKAYRGKPIAETFKEVQDIAAGIARNKIYSSVGDAVKRAYIDYGNLASLAEWGQKAMTGGKFKGGTGGLLSAIKEAVLTPIATVGGQVIYKVGQGMEFIGAPGARYLSDLFNEDSQTSQ